MNAARNRFSVVIDASAPVPPYPADTRAKGWRFDLDYERIEQSDTWVLTPADMRPWLLMLWLTAWKQTPCGSLPTQDELIAARIGMDLRQFRAHRDLLMRGWEVHNDGRYYHHVITEQVLSLIAGREKENAWKRGQRNKKQQLTEQCPPGHSDDSSRNQCGVHAPSPSPSPSPSPKSTSGVVEIDKGVQGETSADAESAQRKRRTSNPESASAERPAKKGKPAKQLTADDLADCGITTSIAEAWLSIRTAKRLPLTAGAWEVVAAEAEAAGLTPADAVRECVAHGWAGFKATWLQQRPQPGAGRPPQRQAAAESGDDAERARREETTRQAMTLLGISTSAKTPTETVEVIRDR